MTDFPDIKLKAVVSFPAAVLDGAGIDVVKENGTYQLNLDFGDFAPPITSIPPGAAANMNALLWNNLTGVYSLTPITHFTATAPGTLPPLMDGVASAGVSLFYSREDHRHPTDTSLASVTYVDAADALKADKTYVDTQDALKADIASPTFTGDPKAPTAAPGDNDTSIATTAFVTAAVVAAGSVVPSNANPAMNGVAAPGASALYSRGDHVHPTDTSLAPKASPVFTGDPQAPTPAAGDNDTSIATTAFVNSVVGAGGQCKLVLTSATVLTLKPFDGNALKINGALNAIPAAGVTLGNGGLSASTLYYIYAFMSAGVMTLEASATTHAQSATAGNIGTEIKSGDNTRSLVGMIATNASSQFVDSQTNRQVRSWFNDNGVAGGVGTGNNIGVTSTVLAEIEVATRVFVLRWANEQYMASATSQTFCAVTTTVFYIAVWLDGVAVGSQGSAQSATANAQVAMTSFAAGVIAAADGLSFFSVAGATSAGTTQFATKGCMVMTQRR